MEPTCIRNAKVSAFSTTALIEDNTERFDDNGCVTDADGNAFDKNGKFVGRTWEAVRDELTWELSTAYGIDFFKIDRMTAAGMLKAKDITNELLLSPDFKFVPNPARAPKPWPKFDDEEIVDEELEREIERATEEAIAEMVAEDDWDDDNDTL
jgi:hypothetical protein